MNYVIGDTAILRDHAVDRDGDFLWVLPFIDVADDGTETPTDLTDCAFEFTVWDPDGITVKVDLTVGAGITVTDNVVRVAIDNADMADWTRGCLFPCRFRYTNAGGFKKTLFRGKFSTT